MADQLQIDLVFVSNPDDALAALVDINDAAEIVTRTVNEAWDVAGDLAKELGGVDAPGLQAAADAVTAMGAADLSGLEAGVGALVDAAVPAEAVNAALSEAAIAAAGIGEAATVDPAGAEQLATSLDDAVAAATGLGANLEDAFADAVAEAGGLSGSVADVAAAAAAAGDATAEMADRFDDAAASAEEAADVVAALSSAAEDNADAQDDAAEGAETTAGNLGDVNTQLQQGGALASYLKDQFVGIVDASHNVLPNIGNITSGLLGAVKSLTGGGIAGTIGLGVAAGAAAALVAGEKYKSAMDVIVTTTGATGERLDSLRGSFEDLLGSSGKNATELATIMSQLNRDTGLTGDGLETLTKNTSSFLRVTGGGVGDVRALTQAMKALGIEMGDAARFQDQVTAAQKAFGGNVSSILSQIRTAGPALGTLGFDTGQIAGLVTQFDQAGLSVQRLIPGLTKLAREATQHGETASSAFGGLTERIKGAADTTAALDEVQGVFSGRMAVQFVTAVRNGTISVEEINKVMGQSPGIVGRLGSELSSLGGQLAAIRNQFAVVLGPVGADILKGLREGVEDVKPSMKELADILKVFAPAFEGFAQGLLIPLAIISKLSGPLDFLGDLLDRIPEPLLELAGIFTAMRLVPFQKIASGILDIANSLVRYTTQTIAATTARAAFAKAGEFGAAVSALAPIQGPTLSAADELAAGGVLAGARARAAAKAAADAAEAAEDAAAETAQKAARSATARANQTAAGAASGGMGGPIGLAVTTGVSLAMLGLTLAMDAAAKKSEELKRESEALGKALGGLSIIVDEAADPFRKLAADPEGGFLDKGNLDKLAQAKLTIEDLRKSIVDVVKDPGGSNVGEELRRRMIESFGGVLPLIKATHPELAKTAEEAAKTAGWAEKQSDFFIEHGYLMGQRVALAEQLEALGADGLKEANLAAEAEIARLRGNQELTSEMEKQALANLQIKDIKGDEALFLQEANRLLAEQLLLKHKIDSVDVATDARHAAFLTVLGEQGLLQGDITKATDLRVKSHQAMNEAMRDGVVTEKEWTVINDQMTESGFTQEEMVKGLQAAHEQLQAVQAKYPTNTAAMDAAQVRTADLMSQGYDKARALGQAAAELGVDVEALDGKFSSVADGAMAKFGEQTVASDASISQLQRSMADGVLTGEEYADFLHIVGGNEKVAQQALDEFTAGVEKTRAALDKLNPALGETASKLSDLSKAPFGPDAEAQKAEIEGIAATRKAAIDAEVADLEARKAAEGADVAGLQARIDALKASADEVEGLKERSLVALKVFSDEEQSLRGLAAARTGDINDRIAKIEEIKRLAQEEAAARGTTFDPAALDAQIAVLVDQRNKVSAESEASLTQARGHSQEVGALVAASEGGMLAIDGLFTTWQSQMNTQVNQFALIEQLRKQGLEDTVAALLSPESGLSQAEIAARLQEVATMTPQEQEALERKAEALRAEQERIEKEKGKFGDIFAKVNPEFVAHAETQGKAVGQGLTDGFVAGIEDSHFVDIIKGILTGQSPQEILEKFKPKGKAAIQGFMGGAETQLKESPLPIEAGKDVTFHVREQFGLDGATGAAKFLGTAEQQFAENPLPIETADKLTKDVNAGMPAAGWAGGGKYKGGAKDNLETEPLPIETADKLTVDLNAGMPASGWAGASGYKGSYKDNLETEPLPASTGEAMVKDVNAGWPASGWAHGGRFKGGFKGNLEEEPLPASTGDALVANVKGTEGVSGMWLHGWGTGRNWGKGVAAGIDDSQTDAMTAAYNLANQVDITGRATLESASPSRKGMRLGAAWAEGVAIGITDNTGLVEKAAMGVGTAVAAPLPVPSVAGIDSAAISAAQVARPAPTAGAVVNIGTVTVTGSTNATADEVAAAMARKIGFVGVGGAVITGRNEL